LHLALPSVGRKTAEGIDDIHQAIQHVVRAGGAVMREAIVLGVAEREGWILGVR
jgi:hypothetical protein